MQRRFGRWLGLCCALCLWGTSALAQERTYSARRDRLTELPLDLTQRKDWVAVDLRANQLDAFPHILSQCDSLRTLRLGSNPLDWRDTLSGFPALEYLDLWDTDIDAVPLQVRGFTALKKLDLRNTYLDEKNRADLEAVFPGVEILLSERCTCRPKK